MQHYFLQFFMFKLVSYFITAIGFFLFENKTYYVLPGVIIIR